ncbi:MAG TPA: protein-disulfide reductase DsbD [Steroidobacteraceae bacterium]|nr:protein-disulfide reductase DsbD [Steroidobacteraceae bacterium]
MSPRIRHILVPALLAAAALAQAQPASSPAQSSPAAAPAKGLTSVLGAARAGGDEFLPPEQAFRFDALAGGSDQVALNWEIADGYYLYRARIKIATTSSAAQLGVPQFPTGQFKTDDYFGRQEIYHHELRVTVPVARAAGGAFTLPLEVTYQGCAEAGLCYPPVTRAVSVTLAGGSGAAAGPGGPGAAAGGPSEQSRFAQLLTGNVFLMIGGFYLAGLLLAFTPCVLPMVPILSGIIAGGGAHTTPGRAFALSVTYVLGMAVTYTAAGIIGAAMGHEVQALFQQWWVLALFAAVFVAMALSMFGLYTVQMPAAIQTRLADVSNRQSADTFGGVAVMGALSALIVTTCVGPALVAALLVISQTGQMVRGGAALFAMSIGMGTPLLVVGASAGKLLPKAGPWMDFVKKLFGVMMLGVAAWMLARIVPERAALILWAVPALTLAWLVWFELKMRSAAVWALRAAGLAAALYGVALAAGAALGGTDPLSPIPAFAHQVRALPFERIRTVADLERAVAQASAAKHGVLLDFSADWCTSCKEMERYTFSDPKVQSTLANVALLRADVTADDADDQALLRHFGIMGPPTIAFYGADGRERSDLRVVGYMKADAFAARAREALQAPP